MLSLFFLRILPAGAVVVPNATRPPKGGLALLPAWAGISLRRFRPECAWLLQPRARAPCPQCACGRQPSLPASAPGARRRRSGRDRPSVPRWTGRPGRNRAVRNRARRGPPLRGRRGTARRA
ncbi:hypothetical protein G6F65_021528 [Rhizopus arrhizus]|nr:hypothetical protein G6F65_021528 [Rhizopus arrhizus]